MKRLFLVLGTAVMVLPWLTGARAQANPIYFDFLSQLSSVPNSVAQVNYGTLYFTPSTLGGGQASLYSAQGTHVAGPSSITVAELCLAPSLLRRALAGTIEAVTRSRGESAAGVVSIERWRRTGPFGRESL